MTREEILRFRNGDPALFAKMVRAESPRLLHYATRLCGDPDEAADLAQEAWVIAFRKREAFRGSGALYSWLISICRSAFLSYRRTSRRKEEILAAIPADDVPHGDANTESGHALVLRREIAEAVASLPDRQRDVLVMRLVHDLSTREVAARLDIPEGTVKSALSRGLDALRPKLEDLKP